MTVGRLAAALAAGMFLLLAVPPTVWADAARCEGPAGCVAAVAEDRDLERLSSGTSLGPSASQPPADAARIAGPLANLPGAAEGADRDDASLLRAATILVALGVVAATAGLALALREPRPVSSR